MRILITISIIIIYNSLILPMFAARWYVYILANLLWVLPLSIKYSRRIKLRGEIPKEILDKN
jgi:uncharacterized membrane protein